MIDFRGFEGSPADAESSDENDVSKNTDKPKIPRKRFPWTDETKYVLSVKNIKYMHIFRIRARSRI